MRKLRASHSCMRRLPKDCAALEEVDLYACRDLDADSWLPASSRSKLRVLNVGATTLRTLPAGLVAVEEVNVARCPALAACWLPADSRRCLCVLQADYSSLECVPENCCALEALYVSGCSALVPEWFISCPRYLRVLDLTRDCYLDEYCYVWLG